MAIAFLLIIEIDFEGRSTATAAQLNITASFLCQEKNKYMLVETLRFHKTTFISTQDVGAVVLQAD